MPTRFNLTAVIATLALATAATAAWAAVTQIDQVGQKFSKTSLSVNAGDDEDDKGLQKPGETIDVLFAKTGRFTVRCAIHPRMKMSVEVQ